jgi:hypothetical protein
LSFADTNLTGPLHNLTDLLNKLAEDPEKIEDAIRNIAITLGALTTIKIGAGLISFIGNLASLKGGKIDASGLAPAGGGAGMPVYVTNWGGSGGGLPGLSGSPTARPGGLVDQYGRPLASGTPTANPGIAPPPAHPAPAGRAQQALTAGKNALKSPKTIATGVGAGLTAALYEIPEMIDTLHDIDQSETMTDREKSAAKGGAVGDATGSIAGATGGAIAGGVLAAMATSALAGTAIGTAIPGLGTIAGLIIGAGIGAAGYYWGGEAGRALGTAIGGAVSGDDATAAQSPETVYTSSAAAYPVIAAGVAENNPGITHTTVSNNFRNNAADNTPSATNNYPVNDLIVTPQGQFSTHPDDYIFAMKNPTALVNTEMRNEVRTVDRVPQALPPVVVNGEIKLHSELFIDDQGYRLRQSVGRNTTPYKFAVGNSRDARLIQ